MTDQLIKSFFEKNELPLTDRFLEVLKVKYVERGVLFYSKGLSSKSTQNEFLDFLKSDDVLQLDEIKITTARRVFSCKNDQQILALFGEALDSIKHHVYSIEYSDTGEPIKHTYNNIFNVSGRPKKFKPRVERIKGAIRRYLESNNLSIDDFSDRKLHILIYDLLSISFPQYFPQHPGTDKAIQKKVLQNKAARITKILK